MAEYINKQQLLEKAKAHLNSPFGAALIIAEIEKTDGVEVKQLTPCDVCAYTPPSSRDGKPCAICPAMAKMDGERRDT